MKNVLFRAFFICLLLLPTYAAADSSIFLVPLRSAAVVNGKLKISYELPCGATYWGLFVSPTDKGKKLRLGAAVKRQDVVCAKLPLITYQEIDYFVASNRKLFLGRFVRSQVFTSRNLSALQPTDIRMVDGGVGDHLGPMEVIYEPRGGKFAGVVLRRSTGSTVDLAVVERPADQKFALSGGSKLLPPGVLRLPSLMVKRSIKIRPMAQEKEDLAKKYFLRLALVKPNSLRRLPDGSITFSYRRECNEAPVGMASRVSHPSSSSEASAAQVLSVGMLVAHYDNFICRPGQRWVWTEFSNRSLKWPSSRLDTRVESLAETSKKDELRLKSPIQYSVNSSKSRGFGVQTIGGCDQEFATVFSEDAFGNLAVGVLQHGSSYSCKKKAKEVSLFQPFTLAGASQGKIYPLRLKGIN